MTTFSVAPRSTEAPRRRPWYELLRIGARSAAVVAWTVLRGLAVVAARVLLWCSADGRRLRTIATGLVICAAVGALVGLGTGLLLTRVVRGALGLLS